MQETSTSPATILQFRQDIEAQFRRHIREALDIALAEELAAALGSDRHERTEQRRGYRNGSVSIPLWSTTSISLRPSALTSPRMGDPTAASAYSVHTVAGLPSSRRSKLTLRPPVATSSALVRDELFTAETYWASLTSRNSYFMSPVGAA